MEILLPHPKEKRDSWFKEPWLLLVIGGPATVVCASLFTATLAFRGADPVVAEDYYRQGLMVNKDIFRDAQARERGISASLQFHGDVIEMQINGAGEFPGTIQLSVATASEHSIHEIVRRLPLQKIDTGRYRGSFDLSHNEIWRRHRVLHLKLETLDWRLTGDWHDPEQSGLTLKALN